MASTVPLNVLLVSLLLLICFILSIVGLLINPWLTGTTLVATTAGTASVDRTLGLWKNCVDGNCQSVFDYLDQQCQEPLSNFRACQALLIIAVIAFFLAAILIVVARYLLNQPMMILGGCLTGIGFLFCLIVILLWKFGIQDPTWNCKGTSYTGTINSMLFPSSELAAGWILVLVATILSLFAFLFTFWFCVTGSARGQKPPPKNTFGGYQRFDDGYGQGYGPGRTYTNSGYPASRYPAPAYSVNNGAYNDPYGSRVQPAPVYTAPPPPVYSQPAPVYSQPAPAYPAPAPVYSPPVASAYSPTGQTYSRMSPPQSPSYGGVADESLVQRCQIVRAKLINTLADDANRNMRR